MNDKEEDYLVHNGNLTSVMVTFPQVVSEVLVSGWDAKKIAVLKDCIGTLIAQNPILSGTVLIKKQSGSSMDGSKKKVISIATGKAPIESCSFWTDLASEGNIPSPSVCSTPDQRIEYMKKHVFPLLPDIKTLSQEAKNKSPVFHVYLLALPDDHLFYSIRMSHAVGDAFTYNTLIEQLSALVNTELVGADVATPSVVVPLDWEGPSKHTQELYLDNMSPRDISLVYGAVFLLSLLPRVIAGKKRHEYVILSRDKIEQKKVELKAPDVNYLTSNDIVVAALCAANRRVGMCIQVMNARNRSEKVKGNFAGNFLMGVPFDGKAGSDPNVVRGITSEMKYYESDKVPFKPILLNRAGRITNWAAVSNPLLVDGTDVLCQMPPVAFVEKCPFDVAVIFSMDGEHLGILHNHKNMNTSGLLGDIMA
jgi:hypothetical protein